MHVSIVAGFLSTAVSPHPPLCPVLPLFILSPPSSNVRL